MPNWVSAVINVLVAHSVQAGPPMYRSVAAVGDSAQRCSPERESHVSPCGSTQRGLL